MIVDKKVVGNTALAPQKEKDTRYNEYETRERLRKQNEKNLKRNRIKMKSKTLFNIVCTFVIGFSVIAGYSKIYSMQTTLNSLEDGADKLIKENENLKVQMLKYSSLSNIEDVAKNKLKMVSVDRQKMIYIDLNKNNFKDVKEESKKTQGFLDKIKKILF